MIESSHGMRRRPRLKEEKERGGACGMCVLRNVLIFGGVFFFFWVKAGLFFRWAGSVFLLPVWFELFVPKL